MKMMTLGPSPQESESSPAHGILSLVKFACLWNNPYPIPRSPAAKSPAETLALTSEERRLSPRVCSPARNTSKSRLLKTKLFRDQRSLWLAVYWVILNFCAEVTVNQTQHGFFQFYVIKQRIKCACGETDVRLFKLGCYWQINWIWQGSFKEKEHSCLGKQREEEFG